MVQAVDWLDLYRFFYEKIGDVYEKKPANKQRTDKSNADIIKKRDHWVINYYII